MKLGIEQIACALDLPRGKIERWIRQGHIPLVQRDHICTFDQHVLKRWAAQHNLEFRPERNRPVACLLSEDVTLEAALRNGGIHYDIEGSQVVDVFQAAVERIKAIPAADKPRLVQKLEERETLTSTGIGKGVAIPHPREPESLGIQISAVAACFLANPVEFQALDGRPVTIMFILLSPSVRSHLQILSRLSFCLRQEAFITFLKKTPEADTLMSRLGKMEALCEKSGQRSG
jgi:PTS system nitrogen regulatory IIA component